MKQNVLSLLQSAIILLAPGMAWLQGQPVHEHVISNNSGFTVAVRLGHSAPGRKGPLPPDERALTIACPSQESAA